MKTCYKQAFLLYFASSIVYGLGLLLFLNISYYQQFLDLSVRKLFVYLYLLFLILSPFYYALTTKDYSTNKPYIVLKCLHQVFKTVLKGKKPSITKEEKTAFLFLLVKLFFLPLMFQFAKNNLFWLFEYATKATWYPLLLTLIFTIDTVIFAFGYTFEFRKLNNVVKSVEPTLFGWIVALVCYPPFNAFLGNYVAWGANDHVFFWTPALTQTFQVLIILLLLIYVAATISLGPKASNLTNRGIVSRFPYSIVRHPAYISKNLVWWITLLPVMNVPFFLGMFFWSIIYYFRAITEERHLLQDPDYQEYCKKVKYKFIPKVW